MSTQVLTELPRIQQAGMDFDSVISEIKDILANNPNWAENWPEFYDSEAGTMLIQLMAWVMDNMSTKQDVLVNEMFLSTAQDDKNKLKLLKQIAYNPRLASSSKVAVRIDFSEMPTTFTYVTPPRTIISNRVNEILRFNSKDINGASIPWEILSISDGKPDYLDSVIVKPGQITYETDKNNNTIYALQGETKYKEFTTETSDGAFFDLQDSNIAADSIQVYITKTMKQLIEVSSFVNKDALDKSLPYPYVIETNEDRTLRLRFGNKSILNASRLLPAGTTISVFYRTTKGSVGNISPGFMNAAVSLKDDEGNYWGATITNDLLANGGTDEETIEDAVLNGPLSLRTMDRAVTPQDYNIILDRNPNVFKSKTYTSTNQPDGFLNYYGRYINPQEAFSLVLLNKNYKDVPSSEYNNFPWITLTKEPRLNEKYVFDSGDYDSNCSYSTTYYNMSIVQRDASIKSFKNATIVSLSDDFNNALYNANGSENALLKLKLSTEKIASNFFDDIEFSLVYPNNYSGARNSVLTMANNYLAADDNAKFVTASAYDAATPIDVNKGRYITVSFDNKKAITIDLWVDRGTDEFGAYNDSEYYLLWTNTGDLNAKEVWGTNKTKVAASHRNGIVEIINQSLAQLEIGEGQEFEEYTSDTSYQYFNLNMVSEYAPLPALQSDAYEFTLSVNNKDYKFKMSNALWVNAWNAMNAGVLMPTEYNWKSTKGMAIMLNWIFQENGGELKVYDAAQANWVEPEGFPLAGLHAESLQTLIFDTDSDNDDDTNFNSVYNAYDLAIRTVDPRMLVNKIYTDNNGVTHNLKNVLWLDDSYYVGFNMFGHTIKGNANQATSLRELIQEPTQGANYNNLASFELISDDSSLGWFKLTSPIKGNSSSISFRFNNSNGGDFMKGVLNLYFNNSGYSYKAYGVKKAYLVKNDALRVYITQDGNEATIEQRVDAGNVIFENSCIYNTYDFTQIFANFKVSESDSIVLGSVYDNFYYSGNEAIDSLLKKEIAGIVGQYMGYTILANGVKSYYIDENKTDLDVRFTSKPQDTNSLYAISSDLDVVKSDRVKLLTACITAPINGTIVMQIDDNEPIIADLSTCKNGTEITDLLLKLLKNTEATSDLNTNRNTIVRNSYTCLNQIQIQNLNRNNGSIKFSYLNGTEESTNALAYRQFLGTNKTNTELYNLYPIDSVDSDCVKYIDEEEYYFCPTRDKDLVFRYRKLMEEINSETGESTVVSRPADFYITIEGASNGDQNSYRFVLHKTENSRFPDTYFYVHFINDKSYDFDSNGKIKETDETILQSYMDKYKISGTDITFISPYFRTYDVAATIKYNANFSEAEVVQAVNKAVDDICNIKYSEIAGSMSRAKILKAIMNCDGVEDCKITYFGYDYDGGSPSTDTLTADFYEILCLNDSDGSSSGKIFTFEMVG